MKREDPERIKAVVGRQVAARRRTLELTQEEFGTRLRVSAQYVGLIERGKQNLGIETLTTLANALGCTVRDLFEPMAVAEKPRPGRPSRAR